MHFLQFSPSCSSLDAIPGLSKWHRYDNARDTFSNYRSLRPSPSHQHYPSSPSVQSTPPPPLPAASAATIVLVRQHEQPCNSAWRRDERSRCNAHMTFAPIVQPIDSSIHPIIPLRASSAPALLGFLQSIRSLLSTAVYHRLLHP